MNDTSILEHAALLGRHGLVLRNLIATYRARRRFRCDLEQMLKESPHLIADIGLTKWQADAEAAKRFWKA